MAVVFYRDTRQVPALEWLDRLPERACAKGIVRIQRLGELGHDLRRPECDYLRDGIYELRWRLGRVNYRVLYFFHGKEVAVLAQGLTKEDKVPDKDIRCAIECKTAFLKDPEAHTHYEELK